MELRWLTKDVFAGFETDGDGEEFNTYAVRKVLQFKGPDGEWIDVPEVEDGDK